ncbi:protein kinase domain-containing protein [Allohahella sp. A8]|uniref:protein kinase domain-containing protein n=1 Tax=Allohahella sp. A8 TaxID=3141461 RepID=UPI003A801EBA
MKKQLSVSAGQFSSKGRKQINQDFHGLLVPIEPLLSTKGIAVAIADGISSSDVSQVASETAIKGFLSDYYCTSDAWSVKTSAQRVLKATNSWLYSQTRNGPYRYNMDRGYICTFSAIVLKSNTAHLFHSGDSRIYRLVDKRLEQLTTDHRRIVSAETSYLTRGLGIQDDLELDYRAHAVEVGDTFVLATDGLFEYLSETVIAEAIVQTATEDGDESLDDLARRLVQAAYDAGSLDNLTLQIVRIEQLPERDLNELHQQATLLPPPPSLAPRMQFDGFEILREIYISSRSHVFLAEDSESGETVVIKTPSAEMRSNEAYLENFFMEEWIAKRINNAHVLKAIEPRRKRNYLYTVTEYLEGKTLAQWMIDNPSPGIDEVRAIVDQISKGLQAFHRQEMVHQDLRPHNVMIDGAGTVKIIDFGATKVAGISEIISKNEALVGTAQYTAPEYFLGYAGTSQSDVFSLGVMTYQMLSGELPYGVAVSRARTVREQQRLSYRSLTTMDKAVPGWLDFAISKAVSIDPLKRYGEVSEFIYELKHPNPRYLHQSRQPLIDRNPTLIWQGISFVLLCLLIWQSSS